MIGAQLQGSRMQETFQRLGKAPRDTKWGGPPGFANWCLFRGETNFLNLYDKK